MRYTPAHELTHVAHHDMTGKTLHKRHQKQRQGKPGHRSSNEDSYQAGSEA
ncbi:MAG: hypothetical protein IJV49_03905 [Aeriscardovia sp.]|nr:hypothetical protein [Aeriscardovia sp.]